MKFPCMFIPVLMQLPYLVSSQLLSCQDVECPMTNINVANCKLGNITSSVVGVSVLNSSISARPLTWTIGQGPVVDANLRGDGMAPSRKVFYLGQPSNLQLQSVDSITGCAIFFQGISPLLKFGYAEGDSSYTDGTCADALTQLCVSNLTAQAYSFIKQAGGDVDCEELGKTLQANPPGSCASIGGSWGQVNAHTITGPSSPGSAQLENCNPTIAKDYSVSLVESVDAILPDVVKPISYGFFYGITPIMTVFAPNPAGGQIEPPIKDAEVHLNCLRVKEDDPTLSSAVGSSGSNASLHPGYGFFAAIGIGLVVFSLFG